LPLFLRQSRHSRLNGTGVRDRLVYPFFPFPDHIRDDGKSEFRKHKEDDAENQRHPEQESEIRRNE
jgi:hypothetical protein